MLIDVYFYYSEKPRQVTVYFFDKIHLFNFIDETEAII